jgi:NarL family two-component system response regulator LiaR
MTATANQQPNSNEPLTQRETEVLYYLFNFELDSSEIAQALSISKATVNFHVLNILSKLSADSRFSAVCMYAKINPEYREAFFKSISQD